MIKKLVQGALLVVGGLALGGCPLEQASTSAPAKRPVAADYQAAKPPSPPATSIRGICYNDNDLSVMHARMVQIELNVMTLQCQASGGRLAYRDQYASFLSKFKPDLAENSRSLQQLSGRKRFNVDVVVTEFANRTGQRAQTDKEFCGRGQRAFDWALSQQVTSLKQVPPPYDHGPDMKVYACPAP